MNFKDLCEDTEERVNGRLVTFSSVILAGDSKVTDPQQRAVIKAVQKAYQDITLFSRHWRFLYKRGVLLTLRADEDEYTLSNVESIDWDSLYLTQSGTTARWPIEEGSYENWKQREKSYNTDSSIPVELIRSPDPDKWIFWPAPSAVYTLNGDVRWKTDKLEKLTDEPCWDEEFHDLVSDLAVRRLEGRVRTRDEIVQALNTKTAQDNFAARWGAFCARYLPEVSGAPALV